jgi:ribosome recycling factor
MENNIWEEIKRKKTEQLEKELKIFAGKLDKIRSNHVSIEVIRGLVVIYHGERKPIKSMATLIISPKHELVVRAFDPAALPLIVATILNNQLGYKLERSAKEEAYFTLLPITSEIRERLVREVKNIVEEGKKAFRLIHQEIKNSLKKSANLSQDQRRNYEIQTDKLIKSYQDKLFVAEEKKIRELKS